MKNSCADDSRECMLFSYDDHELMGKKIPECEERCIDYGIKRCKKLVPLDTCKKMVNGGPGSVAYWACGSQGDYCTIPPNV